jgi:exosortase
MHVKFGSPRSWYSPARNMSLNLTRLRALPLIVILAAAAAIWPTWPLLAANWSSMADYSHGMLLVPVVAVWLFLRCGEIPPVSARASPWAAIVLAVAIIGWLIAYKAVSSIGMQLMAPPILWSAVWLACGLPVASYLAPPLACLYFAIPVWEFLVPGLQRLSVLVAETVLGNSGIPVHIDDVIVTIPEGTFRIAEGCSGKRYFIVALALAALLAGFTRMRPRRALAFMLGTAGLALLMNWLRVLTIIYAGHVSDMTNYLVAREHFSFGWVLFAVLAIIVCVVGVRLAPSSYRPRKIEPGRPMGQPISSSPTPVARSPLTATAMVLLTAPAGLFYAEYVTASAPSAAAANPLPGGAGAWIGPLAPDPDWSPNFPTASSVRRAAYRSSGGGSVEVFVADYDKVEAGAKPISPANTLLSGNWNARNGGRLQLYGAADKSPREVRTLQALPPSGTPWLITYVYQVGAFVTTDPALAQLVYGTLSWKEAISSRVVAAAVHCRESCEEEESGVVNFWNATGSELLASRARGGFR